jgi:hypothetical protein
MFLHAAIGMMTAALAAENPAESVATVNGAAVTRAELDGAFRQTRVSDRCGCGCCKPWSTANCWSNGSPN